MRPPPSPHILCHLSQGIAGVFLLLQVRIFHTVTVAIQIESQGYTHTPSFPIPLNSLAVVQHAVPLLPTLRSLSLPLPLGLFLFIKVQEWNLRWSIVNLETWEREGQRGGGREGGRGGQRGGGREGEREGGRGERKERDQKRERNEQPDKLFAVNSRPTVTPSSDCRACIILPTMVSSCPASPSRSTQDTDASMPYLQSGQGDRLEGKGKRGGGED